MTQRCCCFIIPCLKTGESKYGNIHFLPFLFNSFGFSLYLNYCCLRFGNIRAYRLQLDGVAKNLESQGWNWENGVSWARQQMVVTRYRDEEVKSSVMYDAMDPYEPVIQFNQYADNNENIMDEVVYYIISSYFKCRFTRWLVTSVKVISY